MKTFHEEGVEIVRVPPEEIEEVKNLIAPELIAKWVHAQEPEKKLLRDKLRFASS